MYSVSLSFFVLYSVSLSSRVYIRFFVFTQNTAYELRISDCSSDVCSSDLDLALGARGRRGPVIAPDRRRRLYPRHPAGLAGAVGPRASRSVPPRSVAAPHGRDGSERDVARTATDPDCAPRTASMPCGSGFSRELLILA